ncbi:hypothetical protein NAG84_18865, partial [Proteus terrae]
MDSGGSAALWPPSKFCFITRFFPFGQSPAISILNKPTSSTVVSQTKHLRCCQVKPHGSLVLVSSTYRYAYTP